MKRSVLCTLLLLALEACTQKPQVKPSAPLHTVGPADPPAVCKQLRKQGGAC